MVVTFPRSQQENHGRKMEWWYITTTLEQWMLSFFGPLVGGQHHVGLVQKRNEKQLFSTSAGTARCSKAAFQHLIIPTSHSNISSKKTKKTQNLMTITKQRLVIAEGGWVENIRENHGEFMGKCEKTHDKWRFIAGKIICKWWICQPRVFIVD